MRVRGDGGQGVILAEGEAEERRREGERDEAREGEERESKDVEGWSEVAERWRERKSVREGEWGRKLVHFVQNTIITVYKTMAKS